VTEWDPAKKKIFNTGVMFGRKGEVACHYHKQFLATHDQNWFAFGERGCPVVDTDLGRIGLLICFDGRIPEIFRAMAMQGAEVIVDMANFFAMDQADMWGPARSYDAVMPKHIDLAVCRQKLMIPKVDMFANRLTETYAPIIAA
jgi:predicted amidohydrolase